jgi:hypothetical protein
MSKCSVKKCLAVAAVAGGLLGLALAVKRRGTSDTRTPGPTMWDKMEEAMAGMPETFPPRVMFDNIVAIRKDTTRIIEMLQHPETSPEAGTDSDS